jgi:hypothetical protein
MPCGGIYPIKASDKLCWACDKPGADHELVEWDSVIHGTCVREFLKTEEGQIVVHHEHLIQIGDEVLQEEGKLNPALVHNSLLQEGPPGLGRVWRYNNSDYTWQVAKDLEELRALPWVDEMVKAVAPSFHQLSVSSTGALRAPWDRAIGLKMLMIEYDGGRKWGVLGGLESPELYNLPEWVPSK